MPTYARILLLARAGSPAAGWRAKHTYVTPSRSHSARFSAESPSLLTTKKSGRKCSSSAAKSIRPLPADTVTPATYSQELTMNFRSASQNSGGRPFNSAIVASEPRATCTSPYCAA